MKPDQTRLKVRQNIAICSKGWLSNHPDRIKSSSRSSCNRYFSETATLPTQSNVYSNWPVLANTSYQPNQFIRVHRTIRILAVRSKILPRKAPSRPGETVQIEADLFNQHQTSVNAISHPCQIVIYFVNVSHQPDSQLLDLISIFESIYSCSFEQVCQGRYQLSHWGS